MSVPESTPGWRLRTATPEDESFLKTLFAETSATLHALPPEWRDVLAEMQYKGREMSYAADFPRGINSLVCLNDGTRIGRQLVAQRENAVRVVDIAILPVWQGKGIGTEVLRALLHENIQLGARVELRVAKDNPASRLYQRLGFKVVAEDEISFELAWAAPQRDPPDAQRDPG